MSNDELRQSIETQQQVDHLKEVNDKLLHKYVAEVTDDQWHQVLCFAPLCVILIVLLGITNLEFGLNWSVIIAFGSCCICIFLCDIINAYPLSKDRITITPTHALRETLLKFSWRDRVSTAIYLPIIMGVFIWLAFELRHALNHHVLGMEIRDKICDLAFWGTILVGLICVLVSIIHTYFSTSGLINRLVADIDELNCNKRI